MSEFQYLVDWNSLKGCNYLNIISVKVNCMKQNCDNPLVKFVLWAYRQHMYLWDVLLWILIQTDRLLEARFFSKTALAVTFLTSVKRFCDSILIYLPIVILLCFLNEHESATFIIFVKCISWKEHSYMYQVDNKYKIKLYTFLCIIFLIHWQLFKEISSLNVAN